MRKFNWLFPVLILLTLLLGTLGFYQYNILHDIPPDWLTALYLSLQLFVLNSGGVPGPIPLTLEVSRFLAPALTAGGIFLALWEPLNQNFLLFKIRFWKNHVVVCGLSQKAELLILDFLRDDKEKVNIVLIESDMNHSSISNLKKKGVIVLQGNATDEAELHKANVLKAKYLLALTHDEQVNILIAQKVTTIYNHYPSKILQANILQLILHIDNFYTMKIFKEFHEKAVPEDVTYRKGATQIDYHAFSIYQLGAIFMVDSFSPDRYIPVAGLEDPPAHLLIFGDNIAAEYLILEAAQMYHFANLKKTIITVVADDVQDISIRIKSLYPFLSKTVDIQFEKTIDFFSEDCPVNCDEIAVCFVALDDDGKSVYTARRLRQHLFAQCSVQRSGNLASFAASGNFKKSTPPIKVLLPRNSAMVTIFDDVREEMEALNITLIHMDDEVCNKRTIVNNRSEEDFIAKHIHYEWAKNQAARLQTSVGTMQEEWDKLKDFQKDSNRLPARHLFYKLRYVNADLSDATEGDELDFETIEAQIWDRIARMEHHRWMAEKYIGGFVNIDPIPDKRLSNFVKNNLKCHWDLVPFDQLQNEIQEYDTFTFRMAPAIAKLNRKRILRKQS